MSALPKPARTSLAPRLAWLSLGALFGREALRALAGDRWWWLFLLNTFAEYLFAPVPLALALALRRRRPWLAGVALAAAALAIWRYGRRFWPARARPHGRPVTVLTYNLLGHNQGAGAVIAALRRSGADLIALQELNPALARAIQAELLADYPYQALAPQADMAGMGVISRYPLRALEAHLPGLWVGEPQLLQADLPQGSVELLNVHLVSLDDSQITRVATTVGERERQARMLAEFAAGRAAPLVLLGDCNTSDQSRAYALLARGLTDAWRVAGRGLGHTFPGGNSPGGSRPYLLGLPAPQWLVRIDYVFCSREWRVLDARIGPWDGISDHRPVVATLELRSGLRGGQAAQTNSNDT